MMVFVIFMGCTEKTTADSGNEETTVETTTDISTRSLKCRMTEMNIDQEWDGGGDAYTISYTWDGNVQSFDTGRYTYNDYGYIVEAYLFEENWEQRLTYTYDCDTWCKILSIYSDDGITNSEYTWDGNTQYQGDSRYWEYNDYGYMTYSFESGSGWENSVSYTYECDGSWCRMQAYTAVQVTEDERESIDVEYTWDGNTQIWDQGYSEFNDLGYPLEYFEETEYSRNLYQYTYECE